MSTPLLAPLTEDEFAELILSVGTHRKKRHISPVEAARRIERAITSGVSHRTGTIPYTRESLARKLGLKDPTMLGRFLAVLSIPEEFQQIVNWGEGGRNLEHLTFSVASNASSLPVEKQRELFLEILRHELTKSHALQAIQLIKRNPTKPVHECIESVRPVIIRREIIIGSFPAGSAMLDKNVPADRKEEILKEALRAIFQGERFAARVSNAHFVISTSERGKHLFDEYCARFRQNPNELIASLCGQQLTQSL